MILPALFFYLFAGICVASAVMVIVSRNPVHSVLFLIVAFVNASGLFVLMGAEFLAMILVVVYVGAVAVLFLFVIMMLDVDFAELREGFLEYLPIGLVIGAVFLAELLLVGGGWVINPDVAKSITAAISDRCQQHQGPRARALHHIHSLLPDRRHGAAGGNDRRHRADAAPQGQRQAAGHQCAERADARTRDERAQGGLGAGPAGRRRAGVGEMTIGLGHYLSVGAILFTLGILGIFLNRKNIIVILMSIELILLAVNVNLVAFSSFLGDIVGQVFALLVLTVAAAEAAIGLAVLVVYFRNRGSIAVEDVNLMKG